MIYKRSASFTWTVHPIRTGGWKTAVLTGSLLLLFLVVLSGTGSVGWAVFASGLVAFGVRHYFLPTRFTLSDQLVESKFLGYHRRKPWSDFKRYYIDKNGVFLSPFASPSRLENHRGLYLLFGDRRREVISAVERKMKEPKEVE